MDEPVPVRRAVVGCLLIALLGVGAVLLVRPAISLLAPERDDRVVTVTTATEAAGGPIRRDVLLSRSYGHDGEVNAGDGRVQLALIIGPGPFGSVAVVNAASSVADDCPVEIADDRLVDCDGRAWTFTGEPLDPDGPPLQRFEAQVSDGGVVVDLTRVLDDPSGALQPLAQGAMISATRTGGTNA
jgi:hypothetical protein